MTRHRGTLRGSTLLCAVTLLLVATSASWAQSPPTIQDLYNGDAYFGDERRVCVDTPPVNHKLDFHYWLHFSGMAVIEWPEDSGIVYYFAEEWEGEPTTLSPHVYKSTDGGATFSHVTKIFDVTDRDTGICSCGGGSTTACWKSLYGKDWCIDQMREPDVMRQGNNFYVVWEAAAIENGGTDTVMGPAVIRISDLPNLTSLQTVQFGVNFRQHPLFVNGYDANLNEPGLQKLSASTPIWASGDSSLHVLWTGVYPVNSNWERIDVYRGHSTSSPGGPANCTNPIGCFFAYDEHRVTNPNFSKGVPGKFDDTVAGGRSVIREGPYHYLIYNGGGEIDWKDIGIARSTDLQNWTRKYLNGSDAPVFNNFHPGSAYGKVVEISGEYWLYFLNKRAPGIPGKVPEAVSRLYRRKLKWNSEPNEPIFCSCYSDSLCNF